MPKKLLEKITPDRSKLKENKNLKIFEKWFGNPALWTLNRRSTAKAFLVGLFCAWMPIPFQMVVATGLAILINANVPVSVVLVWITNPLTMPLMFYGAYVLGTLLLGQPITLTEFHLTWDWISQSMEAIGYPFLLGCLTLGISSGVGGYFIIRISWRIALIRKWNQRNKNI
tara:strand:+ start:8146 stop:8658 length:513 start_codon:yes stop_codon:yes gene_type:complete